MTERGPVSARIEDGVDAGTRLTVEVPAGARRLELRRSTGAAGTPAGPARWSLALEEAPPSAGGAGPAEIERLTALGRLGRYADALAGLARLRETAAPADRGPADAAIGRMALGLGDVDRAEPAFRASMAAAKVEERISDVVRDGDALLWAYVVLQQRYADARKLLAEITPYALQFPEGQVWIDADAGLLAADTADIRTALEKYHAAEVRARRLGRARLEQNAADDVARVLTRLGRADEAVAIQRSLPAPADPCARATRALNLSEALMARAAQGSSRARDAEVSAALHAAQVATDGCPDGDRRLLATVNAADYATEVHDDATAARLVAQLQAAPPERDVLRSCRRADVLGRWLLRQNHPAAALATFDGVLPAARGRGLLDEAFRAEVGAGRALLALGRRRGAVTRLRNAQQLLEEMLRGIPLAEGRGSFLGGHDDGVRYLVQALVDGGAPAEAMNVARWIRSIELAHAARLDRLARLSPVARRRWDAALERYQRIRRDIERQAEDDWKLPRVALARSRTEREARAQQARAALDDAYRLLADGAAAGTDGDSGSPAPFAARALAKPEPGELFVAFFPGAERWFVFAATAGAVTVHRIDEEAFASMAAAARALAPLGPALKQARRVRLFPYGLADQVPWHAVVWEDRPLLASVEVDYGLDVGWGGDGVKGSAATTSETAHHGARPTALVVSNPTGDLPAAALEAQAVTRALAGWDVSHLDGQAATREAVLAALPGTRLLHYAGHAALGAGGPLSSALRLSGDGRIELGDLLASPSVPEWVVLSACEAASASARQPSLMGLAQAFVAAGARAALAPTRPVRDADARAFITAFYVALAGTTATGTGALAATTPARLRAAFRAAATGLPPPGIAAGTTAGAGGRADDNEQGSWASFRLLVP